MLLLAPFGRSAAIMYALFQLKTCLRRILYTTVIDATICSKPGYLPLFYLTVGCKVLLYVSRNARMQKKSWVLHRIINVSTLPFPSSHVPPVSECSRLISAKVVYNITDRESLIASAGTNFILNGLSAIYFLTNRNCPRCGDLLAMAS